jgi:membrane-bound lytic murein transglycosylase F
VEIALARRGFQRPGKATLKALAAFAVVALFARCSQAPSTLDRIRSRGELRVVTLNLPTCYYLGAQGPEGLDYDLARLFAAELGVRLKIYAVPSEAAIRTELADGRADIAAAQLTWNRSWERVGRPAAPYTRIPQLVVYRQDGVRPRDTLQLENAMLAVRAGSPQERMLRKIKDTFAPDLQWVQTAPSDANPLEDVDTGQAKYAIVDARTYSYAHHLYPEIQVGFTLPQKRPVQWIVQRDEPDLVGAVNRFFLQMAVSGEIPRFLHKESGDSASFHYEQSRLFQLYFSQRLPLYRSWFRQAGEQYHFDWRLLAAIGFQESHWNPQATSPNGAIGVMMLTASTAHAMGISDRRNARESIFAGARYLAQVRKLMPKHISEPDRTWFILASYNIGFGHLEDARIIAQKLGLDPDSWKDVSKVLPLLADPRWYQRAKYGYAEGWQPVQYVERVRQFLRLLEWQPQNGILLHTELISAQPAETGTDTDD